MGIGGGYQETGRDAHKVVLFGPAHDPVDPAQRIAEEGARGPLFAAGADFFIVKERDALDAVRALAVQDSFQAGVDGCHIVETRSR